MKASIASTPARPSSRKHNGPRKGNRQPFDTYTPYLIDCAFDGICDGDGRLIVAGKPVPVRWVFQSSRFTKEGGDHRLMVGMAYDRRGNFYCFSGGGEANEAAEWVDRRILTAAEAVEWFIRNVGLDRPFADALLEAMMIIAPLEIDGVNRGVKKAVQS